MSRLIKKPILVDGGVTITEAGRQILVKGPKGEQSVPLLDFTKLDISPDAVRVSLGKDTKQGRANVGTLWSLIQNAIEGVKNEFLKVLEIEGIGYKAAMEGGTLVLSLGFVNPIRLTPPKGIAIVVEKNVIKISGIDKQMVGQIAAKIRSFKKPEPYKGKGIRYQGEVVRRKAGKKATASAS
jgi:large subunit ribosomal protein L6